MNLFTYFHDFGEFVLQTDYPNDIWPVKSVVKMNILPIVI